MTKARTQVSVGAQHCRALSVASLRSGRSLDRPVPQQIFAATEV